MADEVRLIDANSLCAKIVQSIHDAEEWINEAKEQQDTHGLRCATEAKTSLLAMLARIHDEPTIETEPVKQDTELSIILQDYGIKDTDTLRYILDQYQKIIVDITGGQLSYLTYPAETVIACADDNYRKCYEEWVKNEGGDSDDEP